MGLNDKEYLFSNIMYYSLKILILFFICTTANLIVDFYNQNWQYDAYIVHYYFKVTFLAVFVSLQAALLNQSISYLFKSINAV